MRRKRYIVLASSTCHGYLKCRVSGMNSGPKNQSADDKDCSPEGQVRS